jgi:peptide chain release factor 2
MTDELELAYEFYREGELTAEELDEQYSSIANHIEAIEFKNMLSDEGDSLSAVLQITAVPVVPKVAIGPKCSCVCT